MHEIVGSGRVGWGGGGGSSVFSHLILLPPAPFHPRQVPVPLEELLVHLHLAVIYLGTAAIGGVHQRRVGAVASAAVWPLGVIQTRAVLASMLA